MKIETIQVEVVKMTRKESNNLWKELCECSIEERKSKKIYVCGYVVKHWNKSDGHNFLHLTKDGVERMLDVVYTD